MKVISKKWWVPQKMGLRVHSEHTALIVHNEFKSLSQQEINNRKVIKNNCSLCKKWKQHLLFEYCTSNKDEYIFFDIIHDTSGSKALQKQASGRYFFKLPKSRCNFSSSAHVDKLPLMVWS